MQVSKTKMNKESAFQQLLQIMTATVETVSEPLDLAAIMPSENVVTAVARSVTLSDADVGKFIPDLILF